MGPKFEELPSVYIFGFPDLTIFFVYLYEIICEFDSSIGLGSLSTNILGTFTTITFFLKTGFSFPR